MEISLLSWNIWGGKYLKEIKEYLAVNNTDIILLQEVLEHEDGSNTAEMIANMVGYNWRYAFSMDYREGSVVTKRGNAILSKFPIIDSKTHVLSEKGKRTALECMLQLDSKNIHVYSVHLNPYNKSGIQDAQAKMLLNLALKENAILAGDFNADPKSTAITLMQKIYTHLGSTTIPTFCLYPQGTFDPASVTSVFDHIFVSPDLHGKNFTVGSSIGSDHLPIMATVAI